MCIRDRYNRGRITKTRWVHEGIGRRIKKWFLKVVDPLNCVFSNNMEPGTTIVADMWRGFNSRLPIHTKMYGYIPVSYTHLDVYKRQGIYFCL